MANLTFNGYTRCVSKRLYVFFPNILFFLNFIMKQVISTSRAQIYLLGMNELLFLLFLTALDSWPKSSLLQEINGHLKSVGSLNDVVPPWVFKWVFPAMGPPVCALVLKQYFWKTLHWFLVPWQNMLSQNHKPEDWSSCWF